MANSGTVYDGMTAAVAMDATTHPSYLPETYLSVALNRQMRGGINRTRPPFTQLTITVAPGQNASIFNTWQFGNFQGAINYQSINSVTYDGMVVAIAGNIFFIQVINCIGYLYLVYSGYSPEYMHTWFCQAEDQLYIQNGYQDALRWDGSFTTSTDSSGNTILTPSAVHQLNPVANQMPQGTIMAYSNGRVFVSDIYNNIYASDIIFGDGFTDTLNTQNFTETQYWATGGSFTPPATMGQITGMAVMPSLNFNAYGSGELVVFCQNGAFTLNTQVPREQWQTANIQRVSMVGRGCNSPWSVTGVNNEIFFRANDGWAFYNNTNFEFNYDIWKGQYAYKKISREVQRWVNADTQWLQQFESAMFFDNRLIATVSPYTVPAAPDYFGQGLHRPSRAMIVADLDIPGQIAPDAQQPFRWDGIWSGPQPTQMLAAQINGQQRGFCFSFDMDGVNRLYELQLAGIDDVANNHQVKIKSFFTTKRFSFAQSQTQWYIKKRITGGDIWLSEEREAGNVEVLFRPDSYACFNTLMAPENFGCDICTWNTANDCTAIWSQPRYERFKMQSPDPAICQMGSASSANQGAEFQLQVNITGNATVDRLRVSVNVETNSEAPFQECDTPIDCPDPVNCCTTDSPLGYYSIVN